MPKLTGKTEFSADTAEVIRGNATVEEAVSDLMRGYHQKSQAIRDQIVDQILKKELDMEDLEDYDRLLAGMDKAGLFPRGREGKEMEETRKRSTLAAKKEVQLTDPRDPIVARTPKKEKPETEKGIIF